MPQYPYTLSDRSFTVFIDGTAYPTDRSNPNWDQIKEELNSPDPSGEQLIRLILPITSVADALIGVQEVRVEGGDVLYGDQVVNTALSERILDIVAEDLPIEPWVAFTQNVYSNPWVEAREELYTWLERSDLPITPDGCILAYKVVDQAYFDKFSHTIDNRVGTTVIMPGGRDAVDRNRWQDCSHGLHFCSRDYVSGFMPEYGSDHLMLIKINPADVVSVPKSETAKGRCWRYEVIAEVPRDTTERNWPAIQQDDIEWDQQGDDAVVGADEPFVDTVACGRITKSGLEALLALHGTVVATADALHVPAGTVQGWKKKLIGTAS